jgi:hypothetical protein
MEIFRTQVSVRPSEQKITYRSSIMLVGSCFSEHIRNKLNEFKFKTSNNPFGIVYNPLSAKKGLIRLIENKDYSNQDIFNHEGVWHSFDHHSRFSGTNPDECLKVINNQLHTSADFLKNCNFLFITFGTAYVYTLVKNGILVSNCHKLPAKEFNRNRISVDDIIVEYKELLRQLLTFNPNLQIIFTVSPIRHWKDGAHENQLSKSTLLLAIDQLCETYKNVLYFPSYEIVMDDLRDYRFYEEDMLHPNKVAIDYIWNRFKECFMEPETLSVMKEVEKVVQALKHRPFNPETEQYKSFLKNIADKIRFLKEQYAIPFTNEEVSLNQFGTLL